MSRPSISDGRRRQNVTVGILLAGLIALGIGVAFAYQIAIDTDVGALGWAFEIVFLVGVAAVMAAVLTRRKKTRRSE